MGVQYFSSLWFMTSQPKKKTAISAGLWSPVLAVLVLVVGFVVYYFVIITQRDSSLDNRAFRS